MPSRKGADFVLYADEGTRRAIRFVNLFFSLMGVVAREMEHDMLNLGAANLHAHFPEFIERLSPPLQESEKHHYQLVGVCCPAVSHHEAAYPNEVYPESKTLVFMFYFHRPLDLVELKRETTHEARELGLPPQVDFDDMKNAARAALEKMIDF